MQPSNQQPSEDEQQAEPVSEAAASEAASSENAASTSESDLVYPPPPSFYQNMRIPAESPQPPVPVPGQPLPPGIQPGFYPPPAMAMQQPFPGAYPTIKPAKRSRKKLWIILSIVGASVLLLCGLCSWGAYSFAAPIFQGVSSVSTLTQDYYQSLEQQNYGVAYTDLQVSNLSQADFTQQAQQRETESGTINSFQITAVSPQVSSSSSSTNISGYTITINVVRKNSTYTVHLNMTKIGNSWKITSFDVI